MLISELLGSDPSLRDLSALIRERADGNPFFCEQIVSALAERGEIQGRPGAFRLAHPKVEVDVPETVQAVLSARIDRLSEREKAVLQTAAVIGREFDRRLLGEIAALRGARARLRAARAHRGRARLRDRAVPRVPLCLQASADARGRLRLAALRHARPYPRDDRRSPPGARARPSRRARRPDRAPLRGGGRAAGGSPLACSRRGLGGLQRPGRRTGPLAARARARPRTAEEHRGRRAPGDFPSDADRGWLAARAGVDEARQLFEEGREVAEGIGDRATLALLHGALGVALGTGGGGVPEWVGLADEGVRIAEEVGDSSLIVNALVAAVYPRVLARPPRGCARGGGSHPRADRRGPAARRRRDRRQPPRDGDLVPRSAADVAWAPEGGPAGAGRGRGTLSTLGSRVAGLDPRLPLLDGGVRCGPGRSRHRHPRAAGG